MKHLNTILLAACLCLSVSGQVYASANEAAESRGFPGRQPETRAPAKAEILNFGDRGDNAVACLAPQPEWAFLGIYSSDVSKAKADKLGFDNLYGSYVTGIIGNTAAEKAGVQVFDYIYGVDEYRAGDEQNLTAILRKYRPGDEAVIHLIRRGERKTLPVKLGRREDARRTERSECEDPFLGVSQTSGETGEGVRVNIVDNSTAAAIGIPKGAVVTHINGYPIIDWTDMGAAVDLLKVGETIEVKYIANGQRQTASGPIKSYCETKTRTNKLFDWDWDFDFDQLEQRRERPADDSRRDISGLKATLSEMPREDIDRLNRDYRLQLAAENNLRIEDLRLDPQAGAGLFRLSFRLPQRGTTRVLIYNDAGRKIYEYDLGPFSGAFADEVDIAQNGPGAYYLLVTQAGKSFQRKITVK